MALKNNIIKARLNDKEILEFEKLKVRLKLKDTYGADSKTIKQALEFANEYLDYLSKKLEPHKKALSLNKTSSSNKL